MLCAYSEQCLNFLKKLAMYFKNLVLCKVQSRINEGDFITNVNFNMAAQPTVDSSTPVNFLFKSKQVNNSQAMC